MKFLCRGSIKIIKPWKRGTPTKIKRKQNLIEQIDHLFEIAHTNALDILSIFKDKLFSITQRKPGRPAVSVPYLKRKTRRTGSINESCINHEDKLCN